MLRLGRCLDVCLLPRVASHTASNMSAASAVSIIAGCF